MSTHNITPNLYSLAGIEKRAMRLLANLQAFNKPGVLRSITPKHTEEMMTIANAAPKAANGAWSPTNIMDYIVNNKAKLPAYFDTSASNTIDGSLAGDFAKRFFWKAYNSGNKAQKQLDDYVKGLPDVNVEPGMMKWRWNPERRLIAIRNGEFPVAPENRERLEQLINRVKSLKSAPIDAASRGLLQF